MLNHKSAQAQTAYITNSAGDNVTVIDVTSESVIATIPVGSFPTGICVSPDGTKVYVANRDDNSLSVINTATNTVATTIAVGYIPIGVVVTPDNSKIYVACIGEDKVKVIDATTNIVSAIIPVNASPMGIDVSPDGSKIYVSCRGDDVVNVISTVANQVIDTISVGSHPGSIMVNPNGNKAYVACGLTGLSPVSYSIIDLISDSLIATIPVASSPGQITSNSDGTIIYMTLYNLDSIYAINDSTQAIIASMYGGNGTYGMQVTPDGTKIYAVNFFSSSVSIISTATNTIVNTVPCSPSGEPNPGGRFISSYTYTGLNESPNNLSISVFPNPSQNGLFTFQSALPFACVDVVDVLGQNVVHQSVNSTSLTTVDLSKQKKGVYFWTVMDEKGGRMLGKILME
ncbi:MAG: T9SS type A sorting domain-containing protein [Bacteroidetes bacterium]|nr:T9SS type A sorting domain-containing protein [Bacteroidota bacterium]